MQSDSSYQQSSSQKETRVIVVGNEKGGSGKTTASMHLIVALLKSGFKIGAMDLDVRQKSLTRYLDNRMKYAVQHNLSQEQLPMPKVLVAPHSELDSRSESKRVEQDGFRQTLVNYANCDFVVIDCPGANTNLSRVAHAHADTVVTPMNDSFVDFDLLARLDPDTGNLLGPSLYSEMVWKARQARTLANETPIDWIVMRNRMGAANAKNKKRVGEKLDALAERIGFRILRGFGERVVYRELFPMGLTLLDLGGEGLPKKLSSMSHVAARQEIRTFMNALTKADIVKTEATAQADAASVEQHASSGPKSSVA